MAFLGDLPSSGHERWYQQPAAPIWTVNPILLLFFWSWRISEPGIRRTIKKCLLPFVYNFFFGLLMFIEFCLWFSTFHSFSQLLSDALTLFHLFSNVFNFPGLRRTGEGFPSAGEQRGRMRRQRFPQMMSFSSCLQVIYIIAFAIYILITILMAKQLTFA